MYPKVLYAINSTISVSIAFNYQFATPFKVSSLTSVRVPQLIFLLFNVQGCPVLFMHFPLFLCYIYLLLYDFYVIYLFQST